MHQLCQIPIIITNCLCGCLPATQSFFNLLKKIVNGALAWLGLAFQYRPFADGARVQITLRANPDPTRINIINAYENSTDVARTEIGIRPDLAMDSSSSFVGLIPVANYREKPLSELRCSYELSTPEQFLFVYNQTYLVDIRTVNLVFLSKTILSKRDLDSLLENVNLITSESELKKNVEKLRAKKRLLLATPARQYILRESSDEEIESTVTIAALKNLSPAFAFLLRILPEEFSLDGINLTELLNQPIDLESLEFLSKAFHELSFSDDATKKVIMHNLTLWLNNVEERGITNVVRIMALNVLKMGASSYKISQGDGGSVLPFLYIVNLTNSGSLCVNDVFKQILSDCFGLIHLV